MASIDSANAERIARLKAYGIGIRDISDKLFEINNAIMFRPFTRLGVYRFDDESQCHKTNNIQCNIPKCDKAFDTVFAYESHYNSAHRFKCSQCTKNLPNAHFLDLHLSEKHDSFFAVQAERKPMYRCYLEECPHTSNDADERRTHCIEQHKFPHDFRFDIRSNGKGGVKGKKGHGSAKAGTAMECDDSQPEKAVLSSSKLITPDIMDEDIELENKSIILAAQRNKRIGTFSFGQTTSKAFAKHCGDHSYAKALSAKSKGPKGRGRVANLEDDRVFDDLMESLPA